MNPCFSILRCLALIPLLLLTGANVFEETFSAGNEAYYQEDYEAAVLAYEQLVGSTVNNPVVFYNLGNAYYRQGRLGEAIVNFERALRLDPGMEGATQNLDKALRATERNLARPLPSPFEQSLFFWHTEFSFAAMRNLAMICWVSAWLLLATRQWRPLRYMRRSTLIFLLFALVFSASAWLKAHPLELAVAKQETVSVHFGNSENEAVRFELFVGDRVQVDAREDGWARVTTVSGERGWARMKDLLIVGEPHRTNRSATETKDSESRVTGRTEVP
jgi:hypothetical protein